MDSSASSAASVFSGVAPPLPRAPLRGRLGLVLLVLAVLGVPLLSRNDYVMDVAILVALNAIVCVGLKEQDDLLALADAVREAGRPIVPKRPAPADETGRETSRRGHLRVLTTD